MKNILFFYISHGSNLTGGPYQLYQLLHCLNKDKFCPLVLSQRHDKLTKKLQECGIEIQIIEFSNVLDVYNKRILNYTGIKKIQTLIGIIKYNIKIASLLKKQKIDVIWTTNLRALLTIAPAAKLLRIPLIWNIWLGEKSEGHFKILNTLGLRLANRVVTEYKNQKSDLFSDSQIKKNDSKFKVVYTSFLSKFKNWENYDYRSNFGLSKQDFVIGTIASIIPRKGHIFVLQAIKELKQHFDNIKWLIVGDIPSHDYKDHYDHLRELVKENNLEDKVFFLGWRDDIPEILSCLDLFVLASFNEGIPVAIREAMAMAKPVVGTNAGGIPDAVKDGQTGIIVPAGDVDAITNAIKFIIQNPEKGEEMGLKGKKIVEELFSLDSYIKNYEKVLSDV